MKALRQCKPWDLKNREDLKTGVNRIEVPSFRGFYRTKKHNYKRNTKKDLLRLMIWNLLLILRKNNAD